MQSQTLIDDSHVESLPLQNKLLLQLWTLCHEPTYLARQEYFVLLGNGELVRAQSRGQVIAEAIAPAEEWLLRPLPATESFLSHNRNVGGIVTDYAVALRLRNLTTYVFKEIAQL